MRQVCIRRAGQIPDGEVGKSVIIAPLVDALEKKAGINKESRSARFCISSQQVDRYGDIVVQNGLDTSAWVKNPIVLYNHMSSRPIGSGSNLEIVGTRTLADVTFSKTDDGETVWTLVQEGILRACSIGFIPRKWERMEDADGRFSGYKFLEAELTEFSVVSVPAVRNALLANKSALGGVDLPAHLADLLEQPLCRAPATVQVHNGIQHAYDENGIFMGTFEEGRMKISKNYQNIVAQRNASALDEEQRIAEIVASAPKNVVGVRAKQMAKGHVSALRARLAAL